MTPVMLPGRISYENIVLSRGIISSDLWDWFMEGSKSGLPEHRSLLILLATTDGIPLYDWDITGAHPIAWTGPQLSADGNSMAIESLELARGEAGSGEDSDADSDSDDEDSNEFDIDNLGVAELNHLAGKVFNLLKRDTRFERERRGR